MSETTQNDNQIISNKDTQNDSNISEKTNENNISNDKVLDVDKKNNNTSNEEILKHIQSCLDYNFSEYTSKIFPDVLSYLINAENNISNKRTILKYILCLINKNEYHADIISKFITNDQYKLNLFKVIIYQIMCNSNNNNTIISNDNLKEVEEYVEELYHIFKILLNTVTFTIDDYSFIFNPMKNFLLRKNNEKNQYLLDNKEYIQSSLNLIQNFNIFQMKNTLKILHILYETLSKNNKKSENYFYFTELSNDGIVIKNKENKIKIIKELNFILFLRKGIRKKNNNNDNNNNMTVLFQMVFNNVKYNDFVIYMDDENNVYLTSPSSKPFPLPNTSVLILSFNFIDRKKFGFHIKAGGKDNFDGLGQNFNYDNLARDSFKEVRILKNFEGMVECVIMMKENFNGVVERIINEYLEKEKENKNKNMNGEEIFNNIIEEYKKTKGREVEPNYIKNELLAVYLPTRTKFDEENNKLILLDTLNNFNAEISYGKKDDYNIYKTNIQNINNPSFSPISSHIFSNFFTSHFKELSFSLFPLLETLIDLNNNENSIANISEKKENLDNKENTINSDNNKKLIENSNDFSLFFSVLLMLFPENISSENKKFIIDEHFFPVLANLLERSKNNLWTNEITQKLINISHSIAKYTVSHDLSKELIFNIFENGNILKKFSIKNQNLILREIHQLKCLYDNENFRNLEYNKYIQNSISSVYTNEYFDNNIYIELEHICNSDTALVKMILDYDKERYHKYCCIKHKDITKNDEDFIDEEYIQEYKEKMENVRIIIRILFIDFVNSLSPILSSDPHDIKQRISENSKRCLSISLLIQILTFDISPCIQNVILEEIENHRKQHKTKFLKFFKDNLMKALFFLYKNSIFEIKILALKLIFDLKFITDISKVNQEKKIELDKIEYLKNNFINLEFYFYKFKENNDKNNKNNSEINPFGEKIIDNNDINAKKDNNELTDGNSSSNDDKNTNSISLPEENNILKLESFDPEVDNILDNPLIEFSGRRSQNYIFSKKDSIFSSSNMEKIEWDINEPNNVWFVFNERYNYYDKTEKYELSLINKLDEEKISTLIVNEFNTLQINFISGNMPIEQLNLYLDYQIKLAQFGNINIISSFMKNSNNYIHNARNKKQKTDGILLAYLTNHKFYHFTLEVAFLCYIYKINDKFIDIFNGYTQDMNKKEIINEIYLNAINVLKRILIYDIFKIDFLFSLGKYYILLANSNNNFIKFYDFIKSFIPGFTEEVCSGMNIIGEKYNISKYYHFLYFFGIVFEFYTFYKMRTNKNKDESSILEQLSSSFSQTFLEELYTSNYKQNDGNDNNFLQIWDDFKFFKILYDCTKPLFMNEINRKMNDETINVYKELIEGKSNFYLNEILILFYSFNKVKKFGHTDVDHMSNKGISLIYILFHYFTLMIDWSKGEDIIPWLKEFKMFLRLIIISSSSFDYDQLEQYKNFKNLVNWDLTKNDYKEIQNVVYNLVVRSLSYLISKIKLPSQNENIINEYYQTIGSIISLLYKIYMGYSLEEEKKKGGFFGLKKIFSFGQKSFQETVSYLLMNKINKIFENTDLFKDRDKEPTLKEKLENNYLNKIELKNEDKYKSKKILYFENLKISLNRIIESANFSKFLRIENLNNSLKIYPFVDLIKKRNNTTQYIIPNFDIRKNLSQNLRIKICVVPFYEKDNNYENEINIFAKKQFEKLSNNLIKNEMVLYRNNSIAVTYYKKIKKRMFCFNNIWSSLFLFNNNNFSLKQRLFHHLSEEFTNVLMKPIVDIYEYLPVYYQFEKSNKGLFREGIDNVIKIVDLDIDHLGFKEKAKLEDLEKIKNINEFNFFEFFFGRFSEEEKNNNKSSNKFNLSYYIRKINFPFVNNIKKNIDGSNQIYIDNIYKNYLYEDKVIGESLYDFKLDKDKGKLNYFEVCLVLNTVHIKGYLYNTNKGIEFYSYNYFNKDIETSDEYDDERKNCFGSIFKPQILKYKNYCLQIKYDDIEFILKRRYYFKISSLEIFTSTRKSYFFHFTSPNNMGILYKNIKSLLDKGKNEITDINVEYNKFDNNVGFINWTNPLINKNNIFRNKNEKVKLSKIYDLWSKWEISSMKLLMILNIFGNRTYNDVNQYPIFPWILRDYTNIQVLNLTKNLRPFDTPMGMLEINNDARERKLNYIEHWKSNKEDDPSDVNYHAYGSHYSTSLYVTYYLLRIFPYSSIRLEIQGKNFDDPNRIFGDIENSFYCATTQKSDIRELIPQFFCFPEIFHNNNKLNLGMIINQETGEEILVENVGMPKWVSPEKSLSTKDAYMFVLYHRELLESPEVSEKINDWFNIIFGSKQKSEDIGNVFINSSYEDYDKEYKDLNLSDKRYKSRMSEFGITPNQVIYKPEPRTKISKIKKKKQISETNNTNFDDLIISAKFLNDNNDIYKRIFMINKDKKTKQLYFLMNNQIRIFNTKVQIDIVTDMSGYPIGEKKTLTIEQADKSFRNTGFLENKMLNNILEAENDLNYYRIYDNGNIILKYGYTNGDIVLNFFSNSNSNKSYPENINNRIYETRVNSPIIGLVIDKSEFYIVCYNALGDIFVFLISQIDKRSMKKIKIIEGKSKISCIDINDELNIFVVADYDGYIYMYSLPQGDLYNCFKLKNEDDIKEINNNLLYPKYANKLYICFYPLPTILVYIKEKVLFETYSINGKFLRECKLDSKIEDNGFLKFTDFFMKEYAIIYDKKSDGFRIYELPFFTLKSYIGGNGMTFVDFCLSKDKDYIVLLLNDNKKQNNTKNEDNNNRNLIIKNNYVIKILKLHGAEIDWK